MYNESTYIIEVAQFSNDEKNVFSMEIRGLEMLGKAFYFILSNKNIFVFALKMRGPETPIKFIKALGEAIRCISSKSRWLEAKLL